MATITTVQYISNTLIRVSLSSAVTLESVRAQSWIVTASGTADAVDVVRGVGALSVGGGWTQADLYVEPYLNGSYSVAGPGVKDISTGAAVAASGVSAAPVAERAGVAVWPEHILRVFVDAGAQELDELGGDLATFTVSDYEPGDVVLLVESSLGFPSAGAVFVGGHRLRYASISASGQALLGVYDDNNTGEVLPYKTVVMIDARAVESD